VAPKMAPLRRSRQGRQTVTVSLLAVWMPLIDLSFSFLELAQALLRLFVADIAALAGAVPVLGLIDAALGVPFDLSNRHHAPPWLEARRGVSTVGNTL